MLKHLLLASLLVGCTSVDQKLDPKIFYKRDMQITVNGKSWNGVAVAPLSDKYDVVVKTPGRMDLFTFTSCHREFTQRDAGNEIKFTYYPTVGIEDVGSCVVRMGAYEKKRGRHAWGLIDFETKGYTAQADVACNGSLSNANGVTVCQSYAGLKQRIRFKYPMKISPSEGCRMLTPVDELNFDYEIVKGECVYEFFEPSFSRRFRLTTVGYEQILIRED